MKPLDEGHQKIRAALLEQYRRRSTGILHLGAHLGQEARDYAALSKPVLWVEALPPIHARLAKHLEKFPGQRALCALLGDRNGIQQTFHISNNGDGISSSMFEFGDYASGDQSLWPKLKLAMVDSVTLPTIRLDTLLQDNEIDGRNLDFWVLDLQGAELLALLGCGDLLAHCRALYVEVSTVEVYRGGVLWSELRHWLERRGFDPLWEPGRPHDNVLFIRRGDEMQ
ncbi:MAG TPA: FkbM family methyltransferase [Burkholderiales bacterium]